MLDKTGLTKEQKETVSKIESRLSMIARQDRAFGIYQMQEASAVRMEAYIKGILNL